MAYVFMAALLLLITGLVTIAIGKRMFGNNANRNKRACVLVLGDFGRSPRMQFHTGSLVRHGFSVDVVSYGGTEPHKFILQSKQVFLHRLPEPPRLCAGLPRVCFLLYAPFKVIFQLIALTALLAFLERPKYLLIQNPPAIPTLGVGLLMKCLWQCHVIIDWHNFGFTILGLTLGERSFLVCVHKWYEAFFGRFGTSHFCVTQAMQRWLQTNWAISAKVLYDRPPDIFYRRTLSERHKFFVELSQDNSGRFDASSNEIDTIEDTIFTAKDETGTIIYKEDRPVLIVSSTSWTADEDFGILLTALELYDKAWVKDKTWPKIVCIITGKGPTRAFYEEIIDQKRLKGVKIFTLWLASEDYPILLGSADLGICLHYSSSGLDLPMKVVDMYGSGLPVMAIKFDCLDELVKHEKNGLVFSDSESLAKDLFRSLRHFDGINGTAMLDKLRDGVKGFQAVRWDASWDEVAAPIFV